MNNHVEISRLIEFVAIVKKQNDFPQSIPAVW
jgi:hypothetical protein